MATIDAMARQRDVENLASKVQLELDNRDYLKFTSHVTEILAMEKPRDSSFEKEMVGPGNEKCGNLNKRKPYRKSSALSLPELET